MPKDSSKKREAFLRMAAAAGTPPTTVLATPGLRDPAVRRAAEALVGAVRAPTGEAAVSTLENLLDALLEADRVSTLEESSGEAPAEAKSARNG